MEYVIIFINWNGACDTLECVRSIVEGGNHGRVIVIDNGSEVGSVECIEADLSRSGIEVTRYLIGEPIDTIVNTRVLIVEAGENLGFAAGCNLGLRVAHSLGEQVVVFLNNDTVVESQAIDVVVSRLVSDDRYFAALPMITIHGTDRVWNCGGVISQLGWRRYFFANRSRLEVALNKELECSFFTGCCFAVRVADFWARGGFSERFFFGEEDFELCLWMKDRGFRAVCLTGAVVQHKVSATINAVARDSSHALRARIFIHYLNRLIHMRLRYGNIRWIFWLIFYIPYVCQLLWRRDVVRGANLVSYVVRLVRRASVSRGVSRADFEAVMGGAI